MAALWMDGFEQYGTGTTSTNNLLAGAYAQSDDVQCGTPSFGARTGTLCAVPTNFSPSGLRRVLPSTKTHLFVSFGVAAPTLVTDATPLVAFLDNANATIMSISRTPTGALNVNTSAGVVATSGPIMVAQNWHFFELEVDTSAHTLVLRVDDATGANTPLMNVTAATITGNIASVAWLWAPVGSSTHYIDDVFIRDSSGTVNNGWLGDRRIATQLAANDTVTNNWSTNRYTKLGAGILDLTATANNGASIGVATATALNIGAAAFTIEGFVRFKSLPTGSNKASIFSRWDQPNNQRSYELFLGSQALNGGSLCWQTSTDGLSGTVTQSIVYPWTPNLDQWYHIAIVRSAGQLLLFVDGQQFGLPIADATTYFAANSPMGFGGNLTTNSGTIVAGTAIHGWMDEIRFTNGVARYTANFTPPVVNFPRNVGGDPNFASVVFLAGFDTAIQDESSFARVVSINQGAVQKTPNDGTNVWPLVGKSAPDDDSYINAPFIAATSILTLTVNPSNGNSVTVGTKAAATPAVYTFKTALASAFDVLIDSNIQNTLQNLFNAINLGPGAGTKYGTGTTGNLDVSASQLPAGQMKVIALAAGTGGNSIATTSSGITGSWTSSTLAGGVNIPGPTNFGVQRLPPTTTLVSAIQINMRAFKSDAGAGTIHSALIGPLGGVAAGTGHALTVSPVQYSDIFETDPDTAGPISPTTLSGGAIQVNRDA